MVVVSGGLGVVVVSGGLGVEVVSGGGGECNWWQRCNAQTYHPNSYVAKEMQTQHHTHKKQSINQTKNPKTNNN